MQPDDTEAIAARLAWASRQQVRVQEQPRRKVAAINEYIKMRDPRAEVIVSCEPTCGCDDVFGRS